jgi:hypothetical protein
MTTTILAPLLLLAAAPADTVDDVCARFAGFDQDGDGAAELACVAPLSAAGDAGARVLVLVEGRLARAADGEQDLAPRLARLTADLGAEGYRAHALAVDLAPSELHQDGRYLLALRELVRACAADDELAGVLLVGHFPDAFVVRTCNWRKRGDVQVGATRHTGVHFLRRVPEDVAHRADIVLADLDGRWEDVYVQPRTRLETVTAVYAGAIPARGGPCVDLARGALTYEDFFHVSDGKLEVRETLGADGAVAGHSLLLDDRSGDHECADTDRARPNVLARPDVLVSRLDARGTALRPRADIAGVAGEFLLDAHGVPQAVEFESPAVVPAWDAVWELDPALERRLLAEYLDRNHAYRTRAAPVAWRASSIACGLGSGYREMARAAGDWQAGDAELADIAGQPTLGRLVDWLAYPAVLRTLRAHSDPWGSVFRQADVDAVLAPRLDGAPWSWTQSGARLMPSLRAACGGGKLDWFLLRTLWEAGAVAPEPCFYHHTGCHGISPPGAASRAYDHPGYGRRQGAEALLLFGNGLALVGRAKVFYDEPRGFAQALAEGATFGAGWARYFELESRAESWGQAGGDIGRKRAYFWSVLGDWSLRLATGRPAR